MNNSKKGDKPDDEKRKGEIMTVLDWMIADLDKQKDIYLEDLKGSTEFEKDEWAEKKVVEYMKKKSIDAFPTKIHDKVVKKLKSLLFGGGTDSGTTAQLIFNDINKDD